MVLKNYIELIDGVPTRMHFRDHAFVVKEITDPLTGFVKSVRSLVFSVDRLGGVEVAAVWSLIQEKLAEQLVPYLEGKQYLPLEFTITPYGKGFQKRFEIKTSPFLG